MALMDDITVAWLKKSIYGWLNPTPDGLAIKAVTTAFALLVSIYTSLPEVGQWLARLLLSDYLTGTLVAIKRKQFSYSRGLWGIVTKVAVLQLAHLAKDTGQQFNAQSIGTVFIFILCANEALSIVQNCRALGAWSPDSFREYLLRIRGRDVNATPDEPKQ